MIYSTAQEARDAGMKWYCSYCEDVQDNCDCKDIFDFRPIWGEYLGKDVVEVPYDNYIEIHIELNKNRKNPSPIQEVIDSAHRDYEDHWIDGELYKDYEECKRIDQKIRDNFKSDFQLIKKNVVLHPGGLLGTYNFDSLDGLLKCREVSIGSAFDKITLFKVTRPNGEEYTTDHYNVVLKDFENYINDVESFSLPIDLGITKEEEMSLSKQRASAYMIHYSRSTAQSTNRSKYKFPYDKYTL